VRRGLLLGDTSLLQQLVDEAVVPGDLGELPVAQQVGTGVAYVYEAEPGTGEQHRGQGGPHPVEFGVTRDEFGDRLVPLVHGFAQLGNQIVAGLVIVEMCQRGDDDFAGDLTGGMSAHAVGERE
jgi:hypothetical protein